MIEGLPPILVVEDDAQQAFLLRTVLWRARIANPVRIETRGDAAEALIGTSMGPNATDPTPVLILLDLHLGDWNGLTLLVKVRSLADAQTVPVVVLSGSGDADDIDRAFEIGANSYLVKPVAFDALIDTLENLALPRAILGSEAMPAKPRPGE